MQIKTELSLLVEVQDICDELEILEKVLKDQSDSMTEMTDILAAKGPTRWTGGRATEVHTQWVQRMQKMATKTKDSVSTCQYLQTRHQPALLTSKSQLYHLLNLKLKQASFSEATDTRKQAQDTNRQTALAAEQSRVMADQLMTMKDQALETGRQGRTLLVFTVVTIIFVRAAFPPVVLSLCPG
jgi:hypothetical protein